MGPPTIYVLRCEQPDQIRLKTYTHTIRTYGRALNTRTRLYVYTYGYL